jgi:hypothetical protein
MYLDVGGDSELSVIGEFGSPVPSKRSLQGYWQLADRLD